MKDNDIAILEEQVEQVYNAIINSLNVSNDFFDGTNDEYICSAKNLVSYLVLRSIDLKNAQEGLVKLGISSLGTSAGYVLENVSRTLTLLSLIRGNSVSRNLQRPSLGYSESKILLQARTKALFKVSENELETRIMVTMPDEASTDHGLLEGLLQAGMEIARINLSHGDPVLWSGILTNLRSINNRLDLNTCVFMDLPGPKIRVESLFKPSLDQKALLQVNAIAIAKDDHIELIHESYYIEREAQKIFHHPIIAVELTEIISDLEVDHSIFFDDGAIEGRVISKTKNLIQVKILNSTKKKLRIGKGINVPNTRLSLPSLTKNDLELLPYACEHADIIGYSFVRTPEDVKLLYAKLAEMNDVDTGVVFKIENKEAFNNLPRILFEAMKRPKIGVMIARGDLAVEVGFDRVSEVKNQILSICEAAHIPVIWATQVLENMAKKGLATRAEISDVVLSVQAECVMLNKGPYIVETVSMLKNILGRMEEHHNKNKKTLRALEVAKINLTMMGVNQWG
ncbi:MAG: pyruvate kinase [Maribacter sp.]